MLADEYSELLLFTYGCIQLWLFKKESINYESQPIITQTSSQKALAIEIYYCAVYNYAILKINSVLVSHKYLGKYIVQLEKNVYIDRTEFELHVGVK